MGTTRVTTLEELIEALVALSDDYGPNIKVITMGAESDVPNISSVGIGTDFDGSPAAILYTDH